MSRPRKRERQLPQYCYRDKRNGALYMLVRVDGKLTRRTYGEDMRRMLADWADTWGATEAPGDTVGDTMTRWINDVARRAARGEIAPQTESDYTRIVTRLRPVWGHVRWSDFDAPAISRWQIARTHESPHQCNREITVLNQVAQLAGRLGLLRDDPMRFIKRAREMPRDRYVTDAEFAKVFEVAPPAVRAAMMLSSITGLRQGDILRLRRADFTDAGLIVRTRKTGQPLHFDWTDGLRQAYELGIGVRTFAAIHWLVTGAGTAYTSDGFRSLWHRAMATAIRNAEQAGQPMARWTFHDLRAKAGTDSRDWKLLGHLDQRTFERVYNRQPRRVTPTR